MTHAWWTVATMDDTLLRFYGYNIRPLAPVHLVNDHYYLCTRDSEEKEVTYGCDALSMDLVYAIVLAHIRPLALLKCSEAFGTDGSEEFSSELFGLSACGVITNLAGVTIVDFDPENNTNTRQGDMRHRAADELYALLNLIRITADRRGNLPYNAVWANPKFTSVQQRALENASGATVAAYTDPELLP